MKRILCMILSLSVCIQMCISVDWLKINAESDTFTFEYFEYTVSGNEATIVNYTNYWDEVDLIIPSYINEYVVTGLGGRAFGYSWNIKSIFIPKTVTNIDKNNNPFYFCSSIESILVEEGNPKYTSVDNCLIDIEDRKLLLGCKNSIIPRDGSVTIIGRDAFTDCQGLVNIEIPDTILEIESSAFSHCENLQSIHIPKSVTYISYYNPFMHCPALKSITVDAENQYYHSVNNCLVHTATKSLLSGCNTSVIPDDGSVIRIGGMSRDYGMYMFSGCTFINFAIPYGIVEIGEGAFNACYPLEKVVVPESVTRIEGCAFRLTRIEKFVLPKSVKYIGELVFADSPIKDIYYVGSESDKESIWISEDNDELFSATWHYNTCEADKHTYKGLCDESCEQCEWVRDVEMKHSYGHLYDPDCNVCGETREVPDLVPGDANGDGNINIKDLGLLQQKLNGWDVTIIDDACDVNGDGNINIKDLGLLQQYLNGWDVELK